MIGSTGSTELARSIQPKGVLELGRAIVQQLELDHRGDILDQWMAHHLAELITAAESSEGNVKQEAEDRAAELILKLWKNRSALPPAADPLSGYRDAIKVLGAMVPSADPWRHFQQKDTVEALLHDMFGAMVHLVMSGLLLTRSVEMRAIQEAQWDALSDEEQFLVEVLNRWHELFVTSAPNKIELDSFYRTFYEDESGTAEIEDSSAEEEAAQSDPAQTDRAAILSHVETFQARLDKLVRRWRVIITQDSVGDVESSEE